MDQETMRVMRAAFRAGYRDGFADRMNDTPHNPEPVLAQFLERVENAGELDLAPDDPCLRCGNPLGDRVPMYVFVSEPDGLHRAKGVRMHVECGKDGGNTVTMIELCEMEEELRYAPD